MSVWGCPYEIDGKCQRVNNVSCDMGMKGCVLFGRFRFADPGKNRPKKVAHSPPTDKPASGDDRQ